jgi:hypothetical protein
MWNLHSMLADARDRELRRELRAREPLLRLRWARARRSDMVGDGRSARPDRASAR